MILSKSMVPDWPFPFVELAAIQARCRFSPFTSPLALTQSLASGETISHLIMIKLQTIQISLYLDDMAAAIHDHVVRSTLNFDHPSSCLFPAAMIRDANNCPHTPESSDDDEGTTETPSPYLDPAANVRKEPTRLPSPIQP